MQPDKRFSLPDNLFVTTHHGNKKSRRHSDDIRSVVELFSIRRNTMCSLHSVNSNEVSLKQAHSIQSFGHLSIAHNIHSNKGAPSNLTLVQVHQNPTNTDELQRQFLTKRQTTTLSSDEIRHIRDKLYTPLTMSHKDSIIADCLPYNRTDLEPDLMSSAVELRRCARNHEFYNSTELIESLSIHSTKI